MHGVLGSVESLEWLRMVTGREPDPVSDLSHYLRGEFQAGQPMSMTGRHDDATGRKLSNRMVSRLEVVKAAASLAYRQSRVFQLRFVEGLSIPDAAERLHISERTLARVQHEVLEALAGHIYDWNHKR